MGEEIAIVSDIHANLEALEAVLNDINALGIKEIHGLGDTVGYGPDPVECINLARERFSSNLMGNHEDAACYFDNATIEEVCKEHSAGPVKWIRWAIFRTNPEIFEYMRSLPAVNLPKKNDLQRRIAEVHGTLCLDANEEDKIIHQFRHPEKQPHDAIACAAISRYSTATKNFLPNLQRCFASLKTLERKVCFVGHTHFPEIFQSIPDKKDFVGLDLHFEDNFNKVEECCKNLEEEPDYVINPGSIGQPRDGDPRASYCIYAGDKVIFRKVPYDKRTTMLKLLAKVGLPDEAATELAARLQDAR